MGNDTINNKVERLKLLTENKKNDIKSNHDYDGIYIFLSFDVVNSTAYKSLNPYWTKTFSLFRDYATKYMTECFREKHTESDTEKDFCDLKFYLWKNLGDEVIFMFPNPRISELHKLPDTSWKVLDLISSSLETPTKNSSVKVSVKATMWIAEIDEKGILRKERIKQEYNSIQNDENTEIDDEPTFQERNINIAIKDTEHNSIDFLGPDIDTGFRLSHYANHNKLTIDARLTWILINLVKETQYHNYFNENAKIVTYKPLKGVWNEKPYPIIWYIPEWDNTHLFYYYEEVDEDTVAYEVAKNDYSFTEINKLKTILEDTKQLDYSNYLLKKLKEINGKQIKELNRIFDSNKQNELHLICLCLNENNELLILKRHKDRKYLPNVWDFGCTYLRKDSNIIESLINGYYSKIRTEIKLLNNNLPINTITIDRQDDRIINALVFIGKVEKKKIEIDKNKYSKINWVKYDFFYPDKHLKQEVKSSYVSGFEDRFNDVVRFLKSIGIE